MLSRDQVLHIGRLARIEVAEAEVEVLRADLNAILSLVERMSAVDTRGVEPMSHPESVAQRLREDRVTEPDRRPDYQAGAPSVEDGLFLVPRVIE
jgi:aspartyl-tRNA(Asn)/glutamyl-tRNA(Gln) amidotransferase subunit C